VTPLTLFIYGVAVVRARMHKEVMRRVAAVPVRTYQQLQQQRVQSRSLSVRVAKATREELDILPEAVE
jgi:hypothetical protein